jgi:hypothetical protein
MSSPPPRLSKDDEDQIVVERGGIGLIVLAAALLIGIAVVLHLLDLWPTL